LAALGIRDTGAKNFGGPVVTAGGLVFIAATPDEKIRAFDKVTGRVLWEHRLPAAGYATPSVYQINGRQFVVIAAGGGGKLGTPYGDAVMAFALPE
jgi:quinoprotein glucose dehydrogenase